MKERLIDILAFIEYKCSSSTELLDAAFYNDKKSYIFNIDKSAKIMPITDFIISRIFSSLPYSGEAPLGFVKPIRAAERDKWVPYIRKQDINGLINLIIEEGVISEKYRINTTYMTYKLQSDACFFDAHRDMLSEYADLVRAYREVLDKLIPYMNMSKFMSIMQDESLIWNVVSAGSIMVLKKVIYFKDVGFTFKGKKYYLSPEVILAVHIELQDKTYYPSYIKVMLRTNVNVKVDGNVYELDVFIYVHSNKENESHLDALEL